MKPLGEEPRACPLFCLQARMTSDGRNFPPTQRPLRTIVFLPPDPFRALHSPIPAYLPSPQLKEGKEGKRRRIVLPRGNRNSSGRAEDLLLGGRPESVCACAGGGWPYSSVFPTTCALIALKPSSCMSGSLPSELHVHQLLLN